MKKTWGFGVPGGPLQFSTPGARDTARTVLRPGEVVVIVGTQDEPTPERQQGKILGLVEPTNIPVSSLAYSFQRRPHDFDEQGNYRWPHGLELRAAWRFLEPLTSLSEVSQRDFGRQGVLGIVAMTPAEEAGILALPRQQIDLLQPLQARARISGEEAARKRAAPPPTTMRTGVMHMRRMSAYTYAMALERGSSSAFKIGWAFNYAERQRQFNAAAMPQLGGIRYKTERFHLWETAMDAFRMEQWLLRRFDKLRHPANREIIAPLTIETLQAAWVEYLLISRR
jgi:hypothetical protein